MMSEHKVDYNDQDYEEEEQEADHESSSSPAGELPEHQYSKDKLMEIAENEASQSRPDCLDKAFDTKEGKWDPERWWFASRENSPLTVDGKERPRKVIEFERDTKRRLSVNDPVERLREERDGIVLSPQRRSFGTGCHVQQSVPYMRQGSLPERAVVERDREREDSRGDRDRERDRDRDRAFSCTYVNRAGTRKIGSGRIAIDRDGGRDFSNLRDRGGERDRDQGRERDRDQGRERDRDQGREREIPWGRERLDRDRDRDRDRLDRDRDRDDWDRDRDRRFDRDRNDRFRRDSDREYGGDNRNRDRRDYRPYDRSGRRRMEDEKEPEWFTGGPTSQNDTIELRGFESESQKRPNGLRLKKAELEGERERTPARGKIESVSEEDPEEMQNDKKSNDDDVFVSSRKEHKQQGGEHKFLEKQQHQFEPPHAHLKDVQQQQNYPPNPAGVSNLFDLDEFLKTNLPLNEDAETQGSRFSRFFRGPAPNTQSRMEDILMPKDLLDDGGRGSPVVIPSPSSRHPAAVVGHMKFPAGFYSSELERDPSSSMMKEMSGSGLLPYSSGATIPNSAGDNNASSSSSSNKAAGGLPPSVTALFNRAVPSGSNACKWLAHARANCSLESLSPSFLSSRSAMSSNSSFSTQDAEAQLKAMLFGGHRDSASSSGTASPAGVPPNFQRRVKTVAELEADMHQSSPQKRDSPVVIGNVAAPTTPQPGGPGVGGKDMTAFNKFLIMINAASEANQNATRKEGPPLSEGYGTVPSHSEFSQALIRNKEHQMQLLHQSMNPSPVVSMQGAMPPPPPQQQHQPPAEQAPPHHFHHLPPQALAHLPPNMMGQPIPGHPPRGILMTGPPPPHPGMSPASMTPQAMSTPENPIPPPNAKQHPQQHLHQLNPASAIAAAAGHSSSSDPIFNLIQQNPTIVMNPASPNHHPAMASLLASSQASGLPASARVPSPIMFSQQPPLHLNAPSPIHPSQLSPAPLNNPNTRSPVLKRGISPQELAAHAQAVMQGALLKQQLHNQSERYNKKQQERAKSPSQPIKVFKPQPVAQPVMPPNPQPKGSTVNTFTPTSVLVKMHSDKAIEKEKLTQDGVGENRPTEFMPSMEELSIAASSAKPNTTTTVHMNHQQQQKNNGTTAAMLSEDGLLHNNPGMDGGVGAPPDASDISFLDPINPSLIAITKQMDNSLRINAGQINILPGSLSQPMSVEEKMKLSSLVEKPGYLSQILDAKAAQAESAKHIAIMGRRPIVRGGADMSVGPEDFPPPHHHHLGQAPPPPPSMAHPPPPPPPSQLSQQQQQQQPMTPQQQQQQALPPGMSMGRPVMGSGVMKGPNPGQLICSSPSMMPPTSHGLQNTAAMAGLPHTKPGVGRAIVGSASSSTSHPPPPLGNMGNPSVFHPEMMRQMEQQKQQQQQQQQQQLHHHFQQQPHPGQGGIVIPPPPPGAIPFMAAGPPHMGMHRVPILASNQAAANHAHAQMMHQHMARANAMNAAARAPHMMALNHQGQPTGRPLVSMASGPLSPQGYPQGHQGHQNMGSLSPAALSATIEQISSPHGKMNGPMNGGGPPLDMGGGGGFQRWFGSDILKTQLPNMPPLPTHSGQVMTVDELERI